MLLKAMGGFGLFADDGRRLAISGRTAALLLLLRHEHPKRYPREDLIWLLWDAPPSPLLRHSLSQLLYSVRRTFGVNGVNADRDFVELNPENLAYDVEELGQRAKTEDTESAANLCTGPFMDGVPSLAGRNFDDWHHEVARDVNGGATRVLLRLSATAEALGDWRAARERAEQVLRFDPLQGEACGRLLRAVALTESGAAAVQAAEAVRAAYEAWGILIPQDLAGTLEIVERRTSEPDQSTAVQTPFLGRQREFAALTRAWAVALRNTSHLIQVTGIAGMGKTRLARQFLRWCAIKGARILATDCSPAEERLAYAALSTALLDGVRIEDASGMEPTWCRRLAHLAPELFPGPLEPTTRDPEWQHRELFEAVARLLASLTDRQPVVLMIDNAQWIDDSTAWIVHYLLHRLRERPLIVLLSRRSDASISSERLRVLVDSAEEYRSTQIDLTAMPLDLSDELIRAQARQEGIILASEEHESIAAASGGVPFRLIQGVKAAAARRWELTRPVEPPRPVLPRGSYDYLINRFSKLSANAVELLTALAVVGRSVARSSATQLVAFTPTEFTDALMEIADVGFVEYDATTIQFAHDLIVELALALSDPKRREALHERAVRVLSSGLNAPAGVLALHYTAAGCNRPAVEASLEAAKAATSAFAYRDAEFFYQLALNRAPDRSTHKTVVGSYIDFLCLAERFDEALSWQSRWTALGGRTGDAEAPQHLPLLQLYRAIGIEQRSASELTERMLSLIGAQTDRGRGDQSLRVMRMMLQLAHVTGRAHVIERLVEAVYREARIVPQSKAGCELLGVIARFWSVYVDYTKGVELANEALALAQRIGDPGGLLLCLISRGTVYLMRGNLYDAERDFDRVLAYSENPELTHYRQRLLNNLGILLLERAKYSEASATFYEAIGLGSMVDQVMVRGNLALVSLEDGNFEQLIQRVQELEMANRILRADWPSILAATMRGYRALGVGDESTAVECSVVVRKSLENGSAAVIMDTSYSEVFVARVIGLKCTADAVAYCQRWRPAHESRNRLGFIRLQLEEARLLRSAGDPNAVASARAVLDECERLGATALARQAVSIISRDKR